MTPDEEGRPQFLIKKLSLLVCCNNPLIHHHLYHCQNLFLHPHFVFSPLGEGGDLVILVVCQGYAGYGTDAVNPAMTPRWSVQRLFVLEISRIGIACWPLSYKDLGCLIVGFKPWWVRPWNLPPTFWFIFTFGGSRGDSKAFSCVPLSFGKDGLICNSSQFCTNIMIYEITSTFFVKRSRNSR